MPGYSTLWGGGVPGQVEMVSSFPDITNASAQILAQDTNRQYLSIQNNNAANINLRLNFGAAASLTTLKIQAGQTFVPNAVPTNAINAMGELDGVATAMAAASVVVVTG